MGSAGSVRAPLVIGPRLGGSVLVVDGLSVVVELMYFGVFSSSSSY